MSWNPLLLVGAVIGVITALLIAAYVGVKDKKTSMGFERNMDDGEILRRLAGYARPYLGRFVLVGFLMLFSIAYDIVSPLIVGSIEELVVGEFELNALFAGGGRVCGRAGLFDGQHLFAGRDLCSGWASASFPTCARTSSPTSSPSPMSS